MADKPANLGSRGLALWSALDESRELTGGNWTLAEEACRIADRLDKLDAILRSDAKQWATFRRSLDNFEDAPKYVLVITGALSEARQQAIVMRQLVAGIPVKGSDGEDDEFERFMSGLSA